MPKNYAIIVAAGKSQRFGDKDKLFADLVGRPVIWHTLKAFQDNPQIDGIILLTSKENLVMMQVIAEEFKKVQKVILGGKTRQDTSYLGLKNIKANSGDIVLFHNGANPLVSQTEIDNVIKATQEYGAAVIGKPKKSTLKKVNAEGIIQKTIERENVWATQTPQGIEYALALDVFQKAEQANFQGTDDVQLLEREGKKVKMVEASFFNFKITDPNDLDLATLILQKKQKTLVGVGQDSHRFSKEDKPLVLGNYQISPSGGFEGNSDGDVIMHALCNALSSTIGGFSLSSWSDEMCQDGVTDSKAYLEKIHKDIQAQDYQINNLSIALEAGKPKLEKHFPAIQKRLAEILEIQPKQIGITVTSGEELTEFGKGEGVQCFCFISLIRYS